MENATQALFIAAGVLIAVLILSLAMFLFSSASSVSEEYDIRMSESERLKYNSQFTKYATNNVGAESGYLQYTTYNVVTDVVSAINLAYNLNESYNYDVQSGIQVVIKGIKYDSSSKKIVYGNTSDQMRNYTYSSSK